jgi:hypothetical protein
MTRSARSDPAAVATRQPLATGASPVTSVPRWTSPPPALTSSASAPAIAEKSVTAVSGT